MPIEPVRRDVIPVEPASPVQRVWPREDREEEDRPGHEDGGRRERRDERPAEDDGLPHIDVLA